MTITSSKINWLIVNFIVYTVGAVISAEVSCISASICLFETRLSFVEILMFLLTLLVCWGFSWGFLCSLCQLEFKQGDSLKGVKAIASYVIALICSYLYPFIMVGG